MSERTVGDKVVDGILAALILAFGYLVGLGVAQNKHANRLNTLHAIVCAERLASHAPTASDSLAVYQDDDFCLKVEK